MTGLTFRQELERSPFVKISIFYMLTLWGASYFEPSLALYKALFTLVLIAIGITCIAFLFRKFIGAVPLMIAYYLVMLLFGYWQYWRSYPPLLAEHFAQIHPTAEVFALEVSDEVSLKSGQTRFVGEVFAVLQNRDWVPVKGRLMVSLRLRANDQLMPGDRLLLRGNPQGIPPPYNPLEFNYKNYLANKDIFFQIYDTNGSYTLLDGTPRSLSVRLFQLRQYFVGKLRQYMHDQQAFQVVAALVFGYRGALDQAVLDTFVNTGTVHVLSVSGMHVAMLFGMLSFLAGLLPFGKGTRYVSFALIFFTIWLYAGITGLAPPILRAAIMISFILIGQLLSRRNNTLNALAASAFVILLASPKMLFDVGFQLSYLAVLGIIVLYPLLRRTTRQRPTTIRYVADGMHVSIAAQVMTTPLSLYYFSQFPIYFLLANLLVTLPATAIMYTGFVFVLCPIDTLNRALGQLLDWSAQILLSGIAFVENLPYSVIKGIQISIFCVWLAYFVIFFCFYGIRWRSTKGIFVGLTCCLILLLVAIWSKIECDQYEGLRIYNTKREITLAYVKSGQALVYSTFPSAKDKGFLYAAARDLQRFSGQDTIRYHVLSGNRDHRTNHILAFPLGKIAVLEHMNIPQEEIAIAIVRKNAKWGFEDFMRKNRPKLVILDGSNSTKNISYFCEVLKQINVPYYILKDNFAYVWDNKAL